MKLWERLYSIWIKVWFRLFFLLDLRRNAVRASRAVHENDSEKMPLENYQLPGEVEKVILKCRYKRDPFKGKWDYINSPEWMQYRINTFDYDSYPKGPFLGDCDDYGFMFGKLVCELEGVAEVYLISTMYRGGAHATCIYRMEDDTSFQHFNYGSADLESTDSKKAAREAAVKVAKLHSKDHSDVVYNCVMEKILKSSDLPEEPINVL